MVSKRQAEAASEALLEAARQQRDKTSPLLVRFPELAEVPFSERAPMVKAANKAVWCGWSMRVAIGGVAAFAFLWTWAAIMKLEIADATWWIPLLTGLLAHQVSQRLVRRELRRTLVSRLSQEK